MGRFPMHAWPLHPSLHDDFVATLDHARANGPASGLILGMLLSPFFHPDEDFFTQFLPIPIKLLHLTFPTSSWFSAILAYFFSDQKAPRKSDAHPIDALTTGT